MTKDRARKRAAHQRANLTGEPYVVARRNVDEVPAATPSMGPATRLLHELTHRVPGVPAHREQAVHTGRSYRPVHHPPLAVREPRILVNWQNWIAQRVGANSSKH